MVSSLLKMLWTLTPVFPFSVNHPSDIEGRKKEGRFIFYCNKWLWGGMKFWSQEIILLEKSNVVENWHHIDVERHFENGYNKISRSIFRTKKCTKYFNIISCFWYFFPITFYFGKFYRVIISEISKFVSKGGKGKISWNWEKRLYRRNWRFELIWNRKLQAAAKPEILFFFV